MSKRKKTKSDLEVPAGWKRIATVVRNKKKTFRFANEASGKVACITARDKRTAITLFRGSLGE